MAILFAIAETIALAAGDPDRVVIDLTIPTPCAQDQRADFENEIVVCAMKEGESPYRLAGVKDAAAQALPRAEITLSNGTTLSAETESVDLGMVRSNRVMARLKFSF